MAGYRLYLLDGQNHIINGTDLEADDDDQAVAACFGIYPDQDWELWDQDRLVRTFSASASGLPRA